MTRLLLLLLASVAAILHGILHVTGLEGGLCHLWTALPLGGGGVFWMRSHLRLACLVAWTRVSGLRHLLPALRDFSR